MRRVVLRRVSKTRSVAETFCKRVRSIDWALKPWFESVSTETFSYGFSRVFTRLNLIDSMDEHVMAVQ